MGEKGTAYHGIVFFFLFSFFFYVGEGRVKEKRKRRRNEDSLDTNDKIKIRRTMENSHPNPRFLSTFTSEYQVRNSGLSS
jgi:hypothetical protein